MILERKSKAELSVTAGRKSKQTHHQFVMDIAASYMYVRIESAPLVKTIAPRLREQNLFAIDASVF